MLLLELKLPSPKKYQLQDFDINVGWYLNFFSSDFLSGF